MMSPPPRPLLAVLVLAAVASGCGRDDVQREVSKASYTTRADGICAGVNARLLALGRPRTADQLARFAQKAVPVVQDGLKRLRGLDPPSSIADEVNAFLAEIARSVDLLQRAGQAARNEDAQTARRLASEASTAASAAERHARAAGLRICGRLPRV